MKVEYIDGIKERGKKYDFKKINKIMQSLDLPDYKMERYNFGCKWNVIMSERSRAKTTTHLLFSLEMYKEYTCTTAYMRTTEEMVRPSNLGEIFGVINEYDYVSRIFGEKYNTLVYHNKHYYLAKRDENGDIIYKDNTPVFHILSIDKMEIRKSTFNDINCDIVLWDEFIDSKYRDDTFVFLMHWISTIFRRRKSGIITLLSNTIDIEHPMFYELDIHDDIMYLPRGESIICQSSKESTRVNVYLLPEPSDDKKKLRDEINMLYFNFKSKALNSITGKDTWDVVERQHISILQKQDKVILKPNLFLYIKYHNSLIRLELVVYEKFGKVVHATNATKYYTKSKVLTNGDLIEPNFIYGIGKGNPYCDMFFDLYNKNKFYYSNNSIGNKLESYFFECDI